MHIKANDTVILLKDISACKGVDEHVEQSRKYAHGKGDTARVLKVLASENRVIVEGVTTATSKCVPARRTRAADAS